MRASVRETYRIEGEKRKRERELFEKQEQLLEESKLMCSLFPGDSEIERETLIQLWMAGGLLKNVYINFEGYLVDSSKEGDALEYYGSLYLQTLENTGLLLPSTLDKSKYRVNPDNNLHGKTQCANRYCQLKEENGAVCAPPSSSSSSSSYVKPWHVSVTLTSDHVDEAALFKTLKEFEGLKTLLLMGSSSLKHVPSDVFTTLRLFHTLDLSGSQISELPSSIGGLTQLHYLDLSYTLIERLPESADCLQELQTLKLNGCKHLVELPPGLNKLMRLRHLHFNDLTKVASMPRGLEALTELRTLSTFIVDNSDNGCNIDELKSLNNLTGSLSLVRLENIPPDYAGIAPLRYKKHIVHLHLTWNFDAKKDLDDAPKMKEIDADPYCSILENLVPHSCLNELKISGYPGVEFPTWLAYENFRVLTCVHLLNCSNTELDISLGELPALKDLEIIQMNRVKVLDINLRGNGKSAFKNLETLVVDGMCRLESWHENDEIKKRDFPKLSKLVIKQCPKLERLPFLIYISSLKHLEIRSSGIVALSLPNQSSLQTLKIINCPSLEEKCSRGGEYWDKIRDIPEVLFSEDADTSIARTAGDDKLADMIASGSEAKPSKEVLPLIPGELDLKLLTGDYELEKERLYSGSEDSTKDGSSADKIASGSEPEPSKVPHPLFSDKQDMKHPTDYYDIEKGRQIPVPGGEGSSKDYHLENKVVYNTELSKEQHPALNNEEEMMFCMYSLLLRFEYEFEKEKLIYLCIAAGFLKDEPMEDYGHLAFDLLLKRGFIKKTKTDNFGGEMYKINSEKDMSFLEKDKVGHFNEKTENFKMVDNFESLSELGSILFLKGLTVKTVPSHIFSALKLLRSFDLSDCKGLKELPSSVSNAKELRHLGLSGTMIERLPESVTELSELQILELKGCVHLFRLPKKMKQLTKLRHLEFDILGQLTSMPEGIGGLAELRTLWAFIVCREEEASNIKELKNMNHLSGKICISGLENVTRLEEAKEADLINKVGLSQLELRWSNTCVEQRECDYDGVLEGLEPNTGIKELQIICFPGSAFPKWVGDGSYANLDSITLYKCEDCKRLPAALGGLPNLKKLEIKEIHGVKEIDDRIPYPALKKLIIDDMRSLKKWRISHGSIFPSIEKLFIKYCPKLDSISFSPPPPPPPSSSSEGSQGSQRVSNNGICASIVKHFTKNHPKLDSIACEYVEIVDCRKLKSFPEVLLSDSLQKLIIKDCPFGDKYREGCQGRRKITNAAEVLVFPCIQSSTDEDSDV